MCTVVVAWPDWIWWAMDGLIDRDGEALAAGGPEREPGGGGRVDADDVAVGVDQGAARVAGLDVGVDLDQAGELLAGAVALVAGGDGLVEGGDGAGGTARVPPTPAGVAERRRPCRLPTPSRSRRGGGGQAGGALQLDDRDVVRSVVAHHHGRVGLAVADVGDP